MGEENKQIAQIGSKILSEDAIRLILPEYESIYSNIDNIRLSFKSENNKSNKTETQKTHDNIFGILGERGSGKTSVVKTIRENLYNRRKNINSQKNNGTDCENQSKYNYKYKNDIILPLIMPEIMESNDLIGWLIGYFNQIVDDYTQRFNNFESFKKKQIIATYQNEKNKEKTKNINNNFCEKQEQFSRCAFEKGINCPIKTEYDNWVMAYSKRAQDYKEIIKENYVGEREYKRELIEYLNSDVNLLEKFQSFINSLVIYLKCNDETCSVEEPIIFIFFDDLDLIPHNSVKMLETIIIYLSCKNIVTFIAGSYENFDERILLKYLRSDQILSKELYEETKFRRDNNKTTLENRQELSYDFLKKLLTPAYRYYLKTISIEGRANFKSGELVDNDGKKTLGELLKGLLERKIGYSYENLAFFEIFDEYPRGLINIYRFLEDNENPKCDIFEKLINLLIISQKRFNLYEEKLKDCFKREINNQNNIEIDYFKIEKLCHEINNNQTHTPENSIDIIIKIYYLAFFVEILNGNLQKLNDKENEYFENKNFIKWLNKEIYIYYGGLDIEIYNSKLFSILDMMNLRTRLNEQIIEFDVEKNSIQLKDWKNLIEIFVERNDNRSLNFKNTFKYFEDKMLIEYNWVRNWFELLYKIYINNKNKPKDGNVENIIAELDLTKEERTFLKNKEFKTITASILEKTFFDNNIEDSDKEEQITTKLLDQYIKLYEIRRLFSNYFTTGKYEDKDFEILDSIELKEYNEKIYKEVKIWIEFRNHLKDKSIISETDKDNIRISCESVIDKWNLKRLEVLEKRTENVTSYISDLYGILESFIAIDDELLGVDEYLDLPFHYLEEAVEDINEFKKKFNEHYRWTIDKMNNRDSYRNVDDDFPLDINNMKQRLFSEVDDFEKIIYGTLSKNEKFQNIKNIDEINECMDKVISNIENSAQLDIYKDTLDIFKEYRESFVNEIKSFKNSYEKEFEDYFYILKQNARIENSQKAEDYKSKMVSIIDNTNFDNLMLSLTKASLEFGNTDETNKESENCEPKNLYPQIMDAVFALKQYKRIVSIFDKDKNILENIENLEKQIEVKNKPLIEETLLNFKNNIRNGLEISKYKRDSENLIDMAQKASLNSVELFEQFRNPTVILESLDEREFKQYLKDIGTLLDLYNKVNQVSEKTYSNDYTWIFEDEEYLEETYKTYIDKYKLVRGMCKLIKAVDISV